MSDATGTVFCHIRYILDPERLEEFREYAATWTTLIRRHGGHHLGFLVSRQAPFGTVFSYPEIGSANEVPVAIAIYSFVDDMAYHQHRLAIAIDPEGIAANKRWRDNPPFDSYERTFLASPDGST